MLEGPIDHRLIVTPMLDMESQLAPGVAALDVRLGFVFRAATKARQSEVNPYSREDRGGIVSTDLYYVPLGEHFVLHPRHFVLGQTLEYFRFPDDLCAYVMGRSTWGRQGLVAATASGVHPGYTGTITFELANVGEIPLRLYPGERVAQLFIQEAVPDATGGRRVGTYHLSTRPDTPRPRPDRVMDYVLDLESTLEERRSLHSRGRGE